MIYASLAGTAVFTFAAGSLVQFEVYLGGAGCTGKEEAGVWYWVLEVSSGRIHIGQCNGETV